MSSINWILLILILVSIPGFSQSQIDSSNYYKSITLQAEQYKKKVKSMLDSLESIEQYDEDQLKKKAIRNIDWGMSQKDVIEKESFSFIKKTCSNPNNCFLSYKGIISGDSVWLWYQFIFDTLVSASYQFYPSSTFLNSYSKLNFYLDMLTLKYGKPDQIMWDWESEDLMYTINDKDIDKADYQFRYLFFTGTLKRVTYQWETISMFIKIDLNPFDVLEVTNMPMISIDYYSKIYDNLIQKSKSEFIEDNF